MPGRRKLDLYKVHKAEYVMPKVPTLVDVKPAKYLTVVGKSAPASEDFQKKVGALYGMAFTIKMTRKFAGQDYKVCHLEGLWWASGKEKDLSRIPPEEWNWKLLIRVPEFINKKDLQDALKILKERGKDSAAAQVKLETIDEGRCVQMLHVGPYADEVNTIAQMMEFAHAKGLKCRSRHHEIYLSDPRRVPPARLRTLLRHPVR